MPQNQILIQNLINRIVQLPQLEQSAFQEHVRLAGGKQSHRLWQLLRALDKSAAGLDGLPTPLNEADGLQEAVRKLEDLLETFLEPPIESALSTEIGGLSSAALAGLHEYVASSGKKRSADAARLLLAASQLLASAQVLRRGVLWDAIYPGVTYDPHRLRYALTTLRGFIRGHSGGMANTKLYRWLKQMDPVEVRQFVGYFVAFFSGNHRYPRAVDLLSAFVEVALPQPQISREELFGKWLGSIPYDSKRLTDHMSHIMVALREFLVVQELRRKPAAQGPLLLQALERRDWKDAFESEVKSVEKHVSEQPIDYETSRHLLQVEESRLAHEIAGAKTKKTDIRFDHAMYLAQQQALLDLLRLACSELAAGGPSAKAIEPHFTLAGNRLSWEALEHCISTMRESSSSHSPIVQAYLLIYDILEGRGGDHEHIMLKSYLEDMGEGLHPEVASDLWVHAINYASLQVRRGVVPFKDNLLQMYKMLSKTDLLLSNGKMSPFRFRTMITILLRGGELHDAQVAFNRFGSRLAENADAGTLPLVQGIIYFFGKAYGDARRAFDEVIQSSRDFRFRNDSRIYILEIELETWQTDRPQAWQTAEGIETYRFEYEARAFREYLQENRAKLSDHDFQGMKNLLNYCLQLFSILKDKGPVNAMTDLAELRASIEANENIYHRDFLLGKM